MINKKIIMEDIKNVMKGIRINLTDLIGDNFDEEEIKERCTTLLKWIDKDRKEDDEYLDYIWGEYGNGDEWEKRMPLIVQKNERIFPIEKALDEVNNIVSKYIIKKEAERKKRAEEEAKRSAERKKQVDDLPF